MSRLNTVPLMDWWFAGVLVSFYWTVKEVFNWEDYSWNEYIKPYHKFNTDLYQVIMKHYNKNNTVNQFFDFTKE